MKIEYEATYADIDKDETRKKLKAAGANLIKPEFIQKRTVFATPQKGKPPKAWLRVRDEGDKITMSIKQACNNGLIESQKEICLTVNDYKIAAEFLKNIGCEEKAYQETKREVWELDGVEICIDEWPFLEPFVEVEGKSEMEVKKVSEKIGFDYQAACFCAVDYLYHKKYNVPEEYINFQVKRITFDDNNPFINNEINRIK